MWDKHTVLTTLALRRVILVTVHFHGYNLLRLLVTSLRGVRG